MARGSQHQLVDGSQILFGQPPQRRSRPAGSEEPAPVEIGVMATLSADEHPGVLIIEDASRYLSAASDKELESLINNHWSNDPTAAPYEFIAGNEVASFYCEEEGAASDLLDYCERSDVDAVVRFHTASAERWLKHNRPQLYAKHF